MKRFKLTIIASLILISAIAAGSFLYAYFYQSKEETKERVMAEIAVAADVYFISGETRYETEEPKILEGEEGEFTKIGVYRIELANLTNPRHLNNLRIDFKVNSTTDTYFRVKIYDSLVTLSPNGDRETTLANTGIKYGFKTYEEDIEYFEDDGNSEFWYLDKTTNWFYYKGKVNGLTEELILPFINRTTSFEGPTQYRRLELVVIVEAVQAHRGPNENWGLITQPWPEGGAWQ